MSSLSSPLIPPSPSAISPLAFREALKLYPPLVEKVYRSKLKNNAKKVADALERDHWRFVELPAAVAAAAAAEQGSKNGGDEKKKKNLKKQNLPDVQDGASGSGGLTKDEVERLVQWKITHGHSRPFLPAMVRKNDASAIQTQTSLAFAKLSSSSTSTSASASASPSTATITSALDLVCKLTGIGPATGTLILNVFDPVHIPFFQDEMFLWFFPPKGKSDDKNKLKYTLKEYMTLLDAVGPVLKRLNVTARELEQVAYILGHMELLDEAERDTLLNAFNQPEGASGQASHAPVAAVEDGGGDVRDRDDAKDNTITSAPGQEPRPAQKGRKRVAKNEDDGAEIRAPKRRSQRKK